MSAADESTNEVTERHESLWFEDGNLVLQAQSVLFKVHRSVLARQSDFFENMLALPSGAEAVTEGTDAKPLLIPEVSSRGLAHLFMMLYTVSGYHLPLSDDEFVEVLLAAHRFQFRDVLEIVPRHVNARLSAERKLELGLQCDLDYWQLRPFQELVLSFRPRDPANNRLSDSVWMKVFAARAGVSQARIDHITSQLATSACGHVVAALVSSVPFSPPEECRTKYWAYRDKARPEAHPHYYDPLNPPQHECCRSHTRFDTSGGWNAQIHTVLPPADTEHAIIAAVWNSS